MMHYRKCTFKKKILFLLIVLLFFHDKVFVIVLLFFHDKVFRERRAHQTAPEHHGRVVFRERGRREGHREDGGQRGAAAGGFRWGVDSAEG